MGSYLGINMDQYWMDLFIWEKFLSERPIKLLIEFGTGYGGMSTYLALQCLQRGITFMTFDNIRSIPANSPVTDLVGLPAKFLNVDIFEASFLDVVKNALDAHGHPACLFFDDGDKPREWRTFSPLAAAGDYLAVHDWEAEFHASDATGQVARILESEPRSAYKTAWFIKNA